MSADCIDSLIDQNLLSELKKITVPNGYNTEIGTVERPRTIISINGRYPYTLVIQMEPQDVEQWAHLRNDKLNYLVWYLDGKGDSNETADGEFIFRLRNIAADISKALKIDVTRGGYAQNTNILKSGFGFFQVGDTFESGVYVLLEIDRILDPNDPYSLAT